MNIWKKTNLNSLLFHQHAGLVRLSPSRGTHYSPHSHTYAILCVNAYILSSLQTGQLHSALLRLCIYLAMFIESELTLWKHYWGHIHTILEQHKFEITYYLQYMLIHHASRDRHSAVAKAASRQKKTAAFKYMWLGHWFILPQDVPMTHSKTLDWRQNTRRAISCVALHFKL